MAKSPYQTAYEDWGKRVQRYQAAGIPSSVYLPIANRDLTKVYSQGSTAMTNADADTSIYAAWKQINPIAEAPRHGHGILGAIEGIAGNIIPDIGSIITSLPRGLAELGKEIVTPSAWEHTGQDIARALQDIGSDPGKSLRDISSSPFLDLIPGVADAAALTTAQGRRSLEEHPVTAALDVLPAKWLTPAVGGALKSVDRSVGAAVLGGTELGARAAEKGVGPLQEAARSALEKAHLDERNRFLSKMVNRQSLLSDAALAKEVKAHIAPIFDPLGGKEAETEFMRKAQAGDISVMTPVERTAYDKLNALQMSIQERHIAAGDIVKTEFGVYNKSAPILRHLKARDKAAARVTETMDQYTKDVTRAYLIKKEAETALQKAVDRVGRAMARGGTELEQAQKALTNAKQRMNGAEKRAATLLRNSSKAYTDARAAVKAADERVQRRLVYISGSGAPVHLHPNIRQAMRVKLEKALEDKRVAQGANPEDLINVEKIPEGMVVQSYQDALKELSDPNADTLGKFRTYVGRQETRQLFSDAVHEQLKLTQAGLTPLFFHEPRTHIADQILRTHLARVKDIPESQTRAKLFNFHESILNPRLGVTEQAAEIMRRDGMQQVYEKGIGPFLEYRDSAFPTYRRAAERMKAKGKYPDLSTGALAEKLFGDDYVKFDFARYGIRPLSGRHSTGDMYLPRSLSSNLEAFAGGAKSDFILQSRGYHDIMRVFRFSVLYGPRHFAHVVLGGLMPLMLSEPTAFLEFPKLWKPIWAMTHGNEVVPIMLNGREVAIPDVIGAKFDYRTDAGYKMLQQKTGGRYATLLKDYWEKTGVRRVNEGITAIEDFAQSLYQGAAYFKAIKRGDDAITALEHARDMVVNLDSFTPFERTVLKQIFPFYSFTRFAVKYLANLPFDHPLRVAILSQVSNQAQEEWGTGLPQTMMSLFFIGHPNSAGNIETINMRNLNPFRSISSMFTIGGFMENLNPILQAPFVAMGYNPLSGSGQLYPNIVYDAQTGTLVAARPKGDLMLAAEQFVPELGGIDALFGISDNLRTLKATDQGSFDRQLLNMFNIPFAASQYNMPQTRGRVAENALKGAQNAVTQYRKTGDYDNTIGRFSLIPYNGQLMTPEQFRAYWEKEQAYAHSIAPGAAVSAVITKPQAPNVPQTLSELINYYGG